MGRLGPSNGVQHIPEDSVSEQNNPASPTLPPVTPSEDNATIRQMREQIAESNRIAKENEKRAAEAEAKLTEIERAKLGEIERLRLEKEEAFGKLNEANGLKTELETLSKSFQIIFEAELAALPQEHRERVEKLTAHGNPAQRLDALREIKALLGTAPKSAGTVTNPAAPGPTQTPAVSQAPRDPSKWGSYDWLKPTDL